MKPTHFLGQATIALSLVMVVTGCLLVVSSAVDASHVVFAYLVPTMLVAMICEPIIATLASLASTLSAAFFLYAPKFNLYVADPKQAAELVAFTVFTIIASRALGIVWRERKTARLLKETATKAAGDTRRESH
jgi:K+-sensing histidine kinase KdpD